MQVILLLPLALWASAQPLQSVVLLTQVVLLFPMDWMQSRWPKVRRMKTQRDVEGRVGTVQDVPGASHVAGGGQGDVVRSQFGSMVRPSPFQNVSGDGLAFRR